MSSPFYTRKFVAATATATMMLAAWVASNWLLQAANNFGTLVTGLGAALTAYTAGNLGDTHITTKNTAANAPITHRVEP